MHFIQCHTSFYTMLVRKGMRLHWLWRSVYGPQVMHQVNLSKAEVMDSHPIVTTRCLLESWHIQHHPNTLNWEKKLCLESTQLYWTSLHGLD